MKHLTGTIGLAMAAGVLAACTGTGHRTEAEPQQPVVVTVVPVAAVNTTEALEAGGVVAAPHSATISSRIVATVTTMRVAAGDRVRAGDVLVVLDARDVIQHAAQARASVIAAENALTQARADHTGAEAEHRLATAWQKRIGELHARNSATDQERDEAEARLAAAAARVASARAAVDGAGAHIAAAHAALGAATATASFATLTAPFDGLITERLVDPGALAAPGSPLVRIDADGARQAVARVDESRAAYLQPGDRVEVVVGASEEPVASDRRVEGVVAEIARAVGADQRTFTIKVNLPPAVTARSGSFARVIFRGRPRRALIVPSGAIQRHGQAASVLIARDGVARLRLIHAGASAAGGVEVLSGLDAGELVITSPLSRVVDGTSIQAGGGDTRGAK